MEIKESKAIFVQVAERICDEIIASKYAENERIPSVREYAIVVELNVNTVMRSYDYLQGEDIIYNKRGIGYFVQNGAREKILKSRKNTFMETELPEFAGKMKQLGISLPDLTDHLRKLL